MYQKCPLCEGSGVLSSQHPIGQEIKIDFEDCTVCKGKKIISELTGLPPKYDVEKDQK